MRIVFVIAVFLFSENIHAKSNSGPKDSTFFINFNIGVNGFSNGTSLEDAFGIQASESTFGLGPYIGIGWEYRLKNKLGIHVDASTNFATRNKKRFMPAFESYYSDFDVHYEMNQSRSAPFIAGGLYNNVSIALSYLFRVKGVGMFPKLIVGYQSSVEYDYRFTLREPGTNYFTTYDVENNNSWGPYFGAGFSVLFSKYDLAAISGEIGYSTMKNNYSITTINLNAPSTYQGISTFHGVVFWKLSLLLRMDFALMR